MEWLEKMSFHSAVCFVIPQYKTAALQFVFRPFSYSAVSAVAVNTVSAGLTVYWHPASDDLPSNVAMLAVAPPPTGRLGLPPTLYACAWGSGVYRSTATAGLSLFMYIRGGPAVNPVTPTILFAGDYYGGGRDAERLKG